MMTSKMIPTFRSALLAAAFAFAPVTAALHAQMADRVQVNVPFDFQDGSKTFAAGVYTLTQSNNLLAIHGADNSGQVMARVEDSGGSTPSAGKVVFQRYGDKYFLREVWSAGESTHAVCIPTSEEKLASKAAKSVAANQTTSATIELATR